MSDHPNIQLIVLIVGVWGGAIAPVIFVAYYTAIADWWTTTAGRTIIALDVVLGVMRVDRLATMIHHPERTALGHADWIMAVAMLAIPVIIIWRIGAFEAKRRRLKRRARETAAMLKETLGGLTELVP